MKITILLLIAILLSGCDAPVTVAERTGQLLYDYNALQAEHETLLINYATLKKAKEELSNKVAECNELINSYASLQTQYAILESYYNNLQEQYTTLLPLIGVQSADREKAMKELAQQYAIMKNRQREITNQIQAVHSESVPILSANLTAEEYAAFYKGWKLWWWTFNEKDEE